MLKRIFLLLLGLFVGLQFFRPAKNVSAEPAGPDDLLVRTAPSAAVRQILTTACYDCHSNQTRYPWYAEIQPGGWFLASHVRDGKRLVNFSEFGRLSPARARKTLEACIDAVEEGEMPLESYQWLHRDARLTEEQREFLVAWLEDAAARLAEREQK